MHPYDFFTKYRVDSLNNNVFVGMWFDEEHKPRFNNIISKAIEKCGGLIPYRVDQPVSGDSIPINILQGILDSRLILFEVSYITPEITLPNNERKRYRSANVMYELGLAHAWRLPEEIIVLREDRETLPFDVTAFRVHTYDPNAVDSSIEQISDLITRALAEIDRAKSIMVKRATMSLDSQCLGFIHDNKGHYFSEKRYEPVLSNIITRLLDLGILLFDTSGGGGSYAYHWTELGRDVIKRLGITPHPKEQS